MAFYPMDSNGYFFAYPEADIPWREKEKIRHEINSNYFRYKGKKIIAHPSLGIDDEYYIYYTENHGFDDINIFARVELKDQKGKKYG